MHVLLQAGFHERGIAPFAKRLLLAALLLVSLPAVAIEQAGMIPPTAKIALVLDRQEFFLGENILIHYCIENTGGPAFSVDVGGDYRGGTRADRFKITASSADGKPVADPNPVQWNMGGLSPVTSLTNGARWFEQVWLAHYCLFEEPGVYTIRVFHDLGWGEKRAADPREVTATITLRRPTPEQARKVVEAMFSALKYGGANWGEKGEPQADFAVLRDPVYLPLLVERATAGSLEGLQGIASIATPEATAALVEFLNPGADRPLVPSAAGQGQAIWLPSGAKAKGLAQAAAVLLQERLPQLGSMTPSALGSDTPRQKKIRQTWQPEFAPPVRAFALRLLTETNRDAFLMAARELNSLGRPEDLPVLLAALDRAVAGTTNLFRVEHGYPEPVSACKALAGVCARLCANGASGITDPTTSGGALLYLYMLPTNAAACPPDWEQKCAALLRHELPYLRAQTLAHLPRPLPESLTRTLAPLMLDSDETVQNQAFRVAEDVHTPEHRALALQVLATATNMWLFDAAFRIALAQGANYECAQIWAQRFDETLGEPGPGMAHCALRALWETITGGHISGGFNPTPEGASLRELKDRWIKFIEDHRDELKAGRRFRPGDGILPKELLPAGWEFHPPKENGSSRP
jgi:hypothetical protein